MDNEFRKHESKNYTNRTRSSRILTIENTIKSDIDNIISDDDKVYDLLNDLIGVGDSSINRLGLKEANGSYQNAVRKYYEFKHNRKFPKLCSYKRQSNNIEFKPILHTSANTNHKVSLEATYKGNNIYLIKTTDFKTKETTHSHSYTFEGVEYKSLEVITKMIDKRSNTIMITPNGQHSPCKVPLRYAYEFCKKDNCMYFRGEKQCFNSHSNVNGDCLGYIEYDFIEHNNKSIYLGEEIYIETKSSDTYGKLTKISKLHNTLKITIDDREVKYSDIVRINR